MKNRAAGWRWDREQSCLTVDNIKEKFRYTEQEMDKHVNFLLILTLKHALFTAAIFLTGMVMCYFFDREADHLKIE